MKTPGGTSPADDDPDLAFFPWKTVWMKISPISAPNYIMNYIAGGRNGFIENTHTNARASSNWV